MLAGPALLACSFITQLVLWHVRVPRRQTPALLMVYAIVPLLVVAAVWATGHSLPFSAAETVRVGLFYVSFALAYIVLHSAIEVDSPTLAIVSYVAKAGANGCSEAALFARFGQGIELAGRLALMERGGWVRCTGDVIRLTQRGRSFAVLYERSSQVFGLTMGG